MRNMLHVLEDVHASLVRKSSHQGEISQRMHANIHHSVLPVHCVTCTIDGKVPFLYSTEPCVSMGCTKSLILEHGGQLTCRTDLNALAAVAVTAAPKPARLKEGSAPVARTMPIMTGSKAA